MHYHLEVIMPPTDDVEGQLKNIMAPFDENQRPDEDGYTNPHTFWDFYVIGGRWGGEHLRASVDADKLDQFYKELKQRKVTVSGLVFGKQEISPASQIPSVDSLWRDYFPESELNTCPLFNHFNDQYRDNCLDVDEVGALPDGLTAGHSIIAGPKWDKSGDFEAENMFQIKVWNGVTYEDTKWDGNVKTAIEMHHEEINRMSDEAKDKYTVRDDWYAVTVDYHS